MVPYSGYMSPEYAIAGLYSTKSDVYSFGVFSSRDCEWEEKQRVLSPKPLHQPSWTRKYQVISPPFFVIKITKNHSWCGYELSRHGPSIWKVDLSKLLMRQWEITTIYLQCYVQSMSVCCVCNIVQMIGQACLLWFLCWVVRVYYLSLGSLVFSVKDMC